MRSGALRIAVCHPMMGSGGSEARALWALEALKEEHDVSLLTWGRADLERLNVQYGTHVRSSDVVVLRPRAWRLWNAFDVADALRGAFFQRFYVKVAGTFDVLVSAYNLRDFGVPAIHCLADFAWDEASRLDLHPTPRGVRGLFHRAAGVRVAYRWLVERVARPSGRDLLAGDDLILANSEWSASRFASRFGVDCDVLYPPVHLDPCPDVAAPRRSTFVCLGRIAPEKRIERVVSILERVRACGHDVGLDVVGDATGSSYGRSIRRLARARGDWVRLPGFLAADAKARRLRAARYGIHACQGEAFGIAVAEMVEAGCIVFVPAEGGAREIVDHEALVYEDEDDAVAKVDAVLSSASRQRALADHLARQGSRFSAEAFCTELRHHVEAFARRHGRG